MKSRRFVLFNVFSLVLAVVLMTGCANKDNRQDKAALVEISKWEGEPQDATTIILVRHGETDYNLEGRLQGRLDIPLNETGLAQADALAEYLKDTKIDAFITSTLQRANTTGEKVAKYHNLQVSTDERLVEMDFGDWAGCYKDDLKKEQADAWSTWNNTPWMFKMPNGENLEMMGTRGAEALHEIACNNEGKTLLIVAHSYFNQATTCELLGLGYQHFSQLAQDNTSITVLQYDGKWKLMMWNAIPHLGNISKGLPIVDVE